MVILKKSIPRRTFLRGAGAALALPMLDSMTPAFAVDTKRPIRMAFMEVPNGIFNLNNEWTPKTEGTGWEITQTLKPLEAFRDRMVVVSGLDNQQAAGRDGEVGGDHPRACTAYLTGTHAKMTSGADIRAGISVDQIAAKEFGKHTQLASLEIGLESSEIVGACESAYGCAYYDTISWRNETTPLPMENRPRAIFERLLDRKSTRLNSSHSQISYAVFCLKKKISTQYIKYYVIPELNASADEFLCKQLPFPTLPPHI